MPSLSPWANINRNPDEEDPTQPVVTPDEQVDAPTPAIKPKPTRGLAGLQQAVQKSAGGVKQMAQDYLEGQKSDLEKIRELMGQQEDLAQQKSRQVNLAPLMALSDRYFGGNLAKNYQAPPSADDVSALKVKNAEALSKLGDPVGQEILREYATEMSPMNKLIAAQARSLNSGANEDFKTKKSLDKMEDDFGKAMNPMTSVYGSGNANLGQRLSRTRSIMALVAQHPNYDLDPREQKDFALGLASLITNQNRVPYELVQSLVPKTFQGDVAKWAEYIMNNPESAESQDFVKRMVDTVKREREYTTGQIGAIQDQQAQRFYPLSLARPDRYKTLRDSGGTFVNIPSLDKNANNASQLTGEALKAYNWAKDPKSKGWTQDKADKILKKLGM